MNMQNQQTKPAADADPTIIACHRLMLAMSLKLAADSLTGPFHDGPDFDAAAEIQKQTSRDTSGTAEAFAACTPTTPLAFLVYLRTFAKALQPEHNNTFDDGTGPDIEEPSYATLANRIVDAFEAIFISEHGAVSATPPAAFRSKALAEKQVKERVLDVCDALQLHVMLGHEALESDDALIAFAIRHGESLDWLILGDETARKHHTPASIAAE